NRALSAAEIAAIYDAGVPNRCCIESSFISQPINLTITQGNDALLEFSVLGTSPLFYEWYFNSNLIANATENSLLLTNLQMSQAGYYLATASNNMGWFATSNALLTINAAQAIAPAPNIVRWWKAETNALDVYGTNNGTISGSLNYATGKVGQAFSFDGQGGYIQVADSPCLNFGTNSPVTDELWAYRTGSENVMCFVGKRDTNCGATWEYQMAFDPTNGMYFNSSSAGVYTGIQMPVDTWLHLAATFDGGTLSFYTNGVLAATNTGTLGPANNAPLEIGSSGGCSLFHGLIDELAIYNRALSAAEIQAIYNASLAGRFIDMNQNGLPDAWERQYFGNLNQTASGDFDGNGMSNLQKYLLGIDPTDYYDGTLPTIGIVGGNNQVGLTNTVLSQPLVMRVSRNGAPLTNAPILFSVTQGGALVASNSNGAFTNNLLLRTDSSGNATAFLLLPSTIGTTNLVQASASSAGNSVHVTFSAFTCASIPSGIVSWWQAEGDEHDVYGTNSGATFGAVNFTNGIVGQAFSFDGQSGYIQVPDSPSLNFGSTSPMTVELWAYRTGSGSVMHFLGKRAINCGSTWEYQMAFDPNSGLSFDGSGGGVFTGLQMPLNTWMHLAATFDGSTFRFYTNGVLAGTGSGTLGPPNNAPLAIGSSGGCLYFAGLIDEVAIYKRALSASEIAAICNSGNPSRCAVAPIILAQPSNLTVLAGQNVLFQPTILGTSPFNFQWYFNSNAIAGATQSGLSLTNVQKSQAGYYSFAVANSQSSALSSNVLLTVNRSVGVSAPSNTISWWRAEANANDVYALNNGSVSGGVTYTPGEVGQAFCFDPSSGCVTAADSPSLRLSGQFSIEAWINTRSTASSHPDQSIVSKVGGAVGNNGYQLVLSGNNIVGQFNSPGQNWPGNQLIASGVMVSNVWTHVAWTYDQSTSRIYINGQLAASSAIGSHAVVTNSAPFRISGDDNNHAYFDGFIDEPAIYSRALSASEIQTIYAASVGGKFQDDNHNGMPDAWEMQYFGNLNQDPNADFDSVGLSNIQEFLHGTDPTNPDTDYDGRNDGQEIIDGTDPLDPNSVLPVQLAYWSFDNTTNYAGAQGQSPLIATKAVSVTGIVTNALLLDSTNN